MREMSGMTRGEFADLVGVNAETIRYYERRSLISRPPRTSAGYRVYRDRHVNEIRFIRRAQELGFTLAEIKELLSLRLDAGADCSDVRRKARAKLDDVREKIADLRRISGTLEELTEACPGEGRLSECPILDSIRENGNPQSI